jgi:RNA polymerase sigma-70 factor, ECF subfamily
MSAPKAVEFALPFSYTRLAMIETGGGESIGAGGGDGPERRSEPGLSIDELLPEVYEELRAIAERSMRSERAGHTLQPSALVHEAYLRLRGGPDRFVNRAHFFASAAEAIRRILVEHARKTHALKRGGGGTRIALDDAVGLVGRPEVGLCELDAALNDLGRTDPRLARVVTLRFFGGLSVEETATTLGLSKRTIEGDWTLARAWLRRELAASPDLDAPEGGG